jgi:hypothetical protein
MVRRARKQCLDDQIKLHKTDSEVKAEIKTIMNGETIGELTGLEKSKWQRYNKRSRQVKSKCNPTTNSRITGISQNIVLKA